MTSENLDRLRTMRAQIEWDAQGALSRAELQRLRQLWGDLSVIIADEENRDN